MPRRSRLLLDTDAAIRRVRYEVGREIRDSRLNSGTSLREAAARVEMSHAQLSRIERGVIEELTLGPLQRAAAAVGLRLAVRAYPGADGPVDRGQLALLGRLRAELPPSVRVRTEVPLPNHADLRAWDAVLALDPDPIPVEAETRLRDLQALERRNTTKLRDGGFDRLILLVADTANNRAVLRAYREVLRSSFPMDTRQMLASLRTGRTPQASGIVIL